MAINYPGPYEVRVFYTVDTSPGDAITHQFRWSCELAGTPNPGDPFNTIDVYLSGGSTAALHTTTLAVINVVEDLFNSTDATFDYAELWKYEAGTFNANFVSSYTIGSAGTSASATVPCSESIFTFRSTEGGIWKLVLLDTVGTPNIPAAYADLNAINKAIVDYFFDSSTSPVKARDGGYPFSFIRLYPGQNEALFKARYGR